MAKAPKAAADKPAGKKRGPKPGSKRTPKEAAKKPGRPPKTAAVAPKAGPVPAADAAAAPLKFPLPSQNTLDNLIDAKLKAADKMSKANASYRGNLADAVKNDHLHKRAWGDVVAANKLEPEDLLEYLEHRDHYFEAMGLNARADSVPRLPMNEPAPETPVVQEAEEEGEPVTEAGGNVTRARFGGRAASEAAE